MMRTGASLFVVAAIVVGGGTAAAQSVTPVGWAADGAFVVSFSDPMQALEWANGAEELLARCAVMPIEGDLSCEVCKDLAACGLATEPKKPKAAKASPDKRVKVTDKRACTGPKKDPEECTRTIGLGGAGTLTLYESNPRRKGTLSVFFRPDSGAAAVLLVGDSVSDEAIVIGDLRVVAMAPPPPPKQLDAKTVKTVALGAQPAIAKCVAGTKSPGTATVRITIEQSGSVSEAVMVNDAGFAETTAGECVIEAIVQLQFPVFTGKPMTVKLPFKL